MQNDIPKKLKYEKKFRLYVMVETSFDLKMLNLGAPMMKIFIFWVTVYMVEIGTITIKNNDVFCTQILTYCIRICKNKEWKVKKL